jgi:hypothetical protein
MSLKTFPQGLKPYHSGLFTARLKPCPFKAPLHLLEKCSSGRNNGHEPEIAGKFVKIGGNNNLENSA